MKYPTNAHNYKGKEFITKGIITKFQNFKDTPKKESPERGKQMDNVQRDEIRITQNFLVTILKAKREQNLKNSEEKVLFNLELHTQAISQVYDKHRDLFRYEKLLTSYPILAD